jgi:hypothetical protein
MKTLILFAAAALLFNGNANAVETKKTEPLKSQFLRQMVYDIIDENVAWPDEDYEGSIWLGEIEKLDANIVGGIRFEKGTLTMDIEAGFICGTEYDESELSGSCSMQLEKKAKGKWDVKSVGECTCD